MNATTAIAIADPIAQFDEFKRQLVDEAPQDTLRIVNASDWIEMEPPPSDPILDETFDRGGMAKAMGIASEDLRNNLMIVNGRGQDIKLDAVAELSKSVKLDVIVFDPLYKLVGLCCSTAIPRAPLYREGRGIAVRQRGGDVYGGGSVAGVFLRWVFVSGGGLHYWCCLSAQTRPLPWPRAWRQAWMVVPSVAMLSTK